MATVINLTLPIAPDMPVGQVWPHDVPFQMEPIRTYAAGGAQLEYYQFHTETGTRLVTRARHDPDAAGLSGVDFAGLVDRRTLVVDVPKGAGELIERREIEEALSRAGGFAEGDAVLIRTGWGETARCRSLGEAFVLQSPRLTVDAAMRLAAILRERRSTLLAIDTPCLSSCALAHAQREWLPVPSWQRPHWPSDIARAYLRQYGPAKVGADWGDDRIVLDAANVLLAIGNASAIRSRYVLLTALPFFAEQSPAAPATVIAKEA